MLTPTPTSNDDRALAWLTLKLLPGLGNRSLLKLVRHFGSPEEILRASAADLVCVDGLRPQAVKALQACQPARDPRVELRMLREAGLRLVFLGEPEYPANLAAIADPPTVLYVSGTLEPRDLVAVAVVGSRAASSLGMAFTERLCSDLAHCGVTIVSGMAVGIDGAAHRGALRAGGRTLAVLGCGLDQDYPREHRDLRRRIRSSGAMLTEFPLGTPPEPGHFPARNRIISGLALGVVVVEAAQRSGSLITARLALEQGREVFAVPGMARNYRSIGAHQLLRQGAKLVETAEDILEEIRPMIQRTQGAETANAHQRGADSRTAVPGKFTRDEAALLTILERESLHIDELARRLHWSPSQAASTLLSLELKGAIRQLPGKHFAIMMDGY